MSDTKRLLEEARATFAPPPDVMEGLIRRRDAKRRRERIAAGSVALAVATAAAFLLRSLAFGAGPQPMTTPTPTTSAGAHGLVSTVDEGRVLFVILRNGKSSVAVIQGDRLERVDTVPSERLFHVTWASPTEIVFDGRRGGPRHLYRMSLETGEVVQLTDHHGAQSKAGISPDGRLMVYDHYDPKTGRDLGMQIADAQDGSDARTLLPPPEPGSTAGSSDAQFSPDGRWIAFTRLTGSAGGETAVFVVRTDGTGLRRLTDDALYAGRPRWSPDGSQILFSQGNEYNPLAGPLWVVPFQGGEPRRLTDQRGDEAAFEADWSPDGTQIVFKYWDPTMENNELRIVNADGTGEHVLWIGRPGETAETPDWGP